MDHPVLLIIIVQIILAAVAALEVLIEAQTGLLVPQVPLLDGISPHAPSVQEEVKGTALALGAMGSMSSVSAT